MEEAKSEGIPTYRQLIASLGVISILLATATMYVAEISSMAYGIAAGALYQSNYHNESVIPAFSQIVGSIHAIYAAIYEVYVLFFIAMGLVVASVAEFLRSGIRAGIRRYSLLHTSMTIIYLLLFFVLFNNLSLSGINSVNSYIFKLIYVGGFLMLGIDLYIEYEMHAPAQRARRFSREIAINPSTPYSNLMKMRDELFSGLSGDVRIIDKHFNSAAIANLYRLLQDNRSIKSIGILGSNEMLDSQFDKNFNDFSGELAGKGISVEFMLMSSENAAAQHERIIFDDSKAFKIPPLNIINKKSEHITRLKRSEASRRYEELSKGAISYKNYVLKQARGNSNANANTSKN
ncbi:MAG: hypothetical protein QXW57_02845 [Candidatus Micrarchaeaceae archaeon]